MTPEERELRRVLEARSGEPSPQFRARLTAAFDEGRPASGLMQAVAMVAVIAITLGTVGVLLSSRGANRVSYGGPVSGPRYIVTTKMMTKAGDRVVACWSEFLSLPPPVCGGVTVTNVDVTAIPGTKTLSNGVVETPNVRLVGTWDGHALRLTERPQVTTVGRTQFVPVTQPMPPSPARPTAEVLRDITRDDADLQKRGISLMEWGEGSDGLPSLKLAVADAASVQYLYDHYGRVNISGWLQPVDRVIETPLPSLPTPTMAPQTPIVPPTTAQVSAPSSNVVLALVAERRLFRSTDQGKSWEERLLPPRPQAHPSISFVNDQEGWLLAPSSPETQCSGAGAEVWHTTDGSATWQRIAFVTWTQPVGTYGGIPYAQCKEYISFLDSTHGFLTAWDDDRPPTIYRTADGGKTWSGITLSDPPDFKTSPGGFTLRAGVFKRFGNTLYVEAWGKQPGNIPDRQYIYRSTDGGATWSWLMKIPSRYIAMVTESRWLQLVPFQSMESTNSGQQWHPYQSDFSTDTPVGGPQVVFADSQVGYAEGRGQLQRTLDGGLHWASIATPGTPARSPAPFPTTHSPLPPQTANWPAYSSPAYGYSLRFSPRWFDLGSSGVPHMHYFSNRKDFDSPTTMRPDDVLAGMSADCMSGIGPRIVISQVDVAVDTVPSVRYFIKGTGGLDGPIFAAEAIVEPGGLCYRVFMMASTQKAIEANLAEFDLMLNSLRFSSRTAPITTSP